MKPVKFHVDAEAEMIEAALWYEKQQINLGKRFLVSVQNAINKISINPILYPFVESDIRRCLIKTFPFGILFRNKPRRIEIIAVMHLHRNPGYWKDRDKALSEDDID